jgi:hypothetical protein
MNKNLFLAAMSAMIFAACSSDDNYVAYEGPVEAQITAGIGGAKTRAEASYDKWTSGTAIGVITTKVTGGTNPEEIAVAESKMKDYVNVKYTVSELSDDDTKAKFTSDNKIYFNDGTYTVDFAAYSPYYTGTEALTAIPISGTTSAVDYIHATVSGKTYSNSTVNFAFEHVMSKLTINIDKASDVVGELTEVKLSKLVQSGTFNAQTGETSSTESAADLTYTSNLSASSFYLIPQSAGDVTVSAKIGDNTYSTTLTSLTLAKGNEYTFNITAKNYGLELTGSTIKAYTTQEAVDKDALL